jgi:hypothetical protein
MRNLMIAVVLLFSVPSFATKLDYPQPGAAISPDGNIIARLSIKPNHARAKNNISDSATMAIFRWDENVGYVPFSQYTLPYVFGPKLFIVGDNGHVITYGTTLADEAGPAIAVFNSTGEKLSAYTLEELFPNDSLRSKIYDLNGVSVWMCVAEPMFMGDTAIGIPHQFGYFLVDLKDGTFEAFYDHSTNCSE